VKLLYAIAFALFAFAPVTVSAQSSDLSLLSALFSDDYYEDATRQCGAVSAGEVLTIELILTKYGVVIPGDADEEVVVLYSDDDPEDTPVGSIQPSNKDAVSTDEKSNAEPANEQKTVASRIITLERPSEIGGEAADVATTGSTARSIPAAGKEPVEDTRTIE
jgi:hypothetical protein